MASLVKKGLGIYCSVGGPFISPFFAPILNLLNFVVLPLFISCWCVLIISIFIPINFSGDNILNTTTNPDNTKRKNPGKAFGFSFLIYYIIMVSCFCVVMQSVCKINDSIDLEF
jgi:hypothetical protein